MVHAPVLAVLVVLQLLLDHVDHDVVGDESSSVHNLLGLDTQGSLLLNLVSQHVPSCQVAHTEVIANSGCLGTLSYNSFEYS